MMNGSDSLYKLIPQIRRARDYRLYDVRGRRYLDCFLDSGRALLGHKPGRTVLMMKNSLEKGLAASYPGIYTHRLLKQIRMIYPEIAGCSVVLTNSVQDDPGYPLFRPFESDIPPQEQPFEFMLPLPGSGMLKVLCAAECCAEALPVPDPVPQYLLSGLCRAAAELAAFRKSVKPVIWSAFNSPLWKRTGPWLYPRVDNAAYRKLFTAFLEEGILLSPYYEIPSCAAYEFTEGEIVPIKKIEQQFIGSIFNGS